MRSQRKCPVYSLILALVGTGLWFQTSLAAPGAGNGRQQPQPDTAPGPHTPRSVGKVLGWGENEQQAREHALEQAKDKVRNYLHKNVPELEWEPGKKYVSKHILKEPPKRRRDLERAAKED